MEGKKKVNIIAKLAKLTYLCEEENEWGGYINEYTGEVQDLVEGRKTSINSPSLSTVTKKAKQGWIWFHTHPNPSSSGPSPLDIIETCLTGFKQYVLTHKGIHEIKPLKRLKTRKLNELVDRLRKEEKEGWAPAYLRLMFDSNLLKELDLKFQINSVKLQKKQ